MAEVTYREALRRALDEELARDERVFLMGEEIGRFEGSYKVTAGLWAKYGPKRVRETPISEEGFVGAGIGAAMLGLRPVVEIMTINFILVAQDMVVNHAAKIRYMFGGKVGVPMVIRTPGRRGRPAHGTALPLARGLVRPHTGTEGRRAVEPAGCVRAAEDGDPRRRPVALRRKPGALQRDRQHPRAGRRLHAAARPRARRARRHRSHDRGALVHGAARAFGRRPTGPEWLRGRGHRPALIAPARRRHGGRVGTQDEPRAHSRGRLGNIWRRRRARRSCWSRVLRRPRRAAGARRWCGGPDAVLEALELAAPCSRTSWRRRPARCSRNVASEAG